MDQSNSQTPAVDGRDVEVADEPETGGQEAAGSEGGEMEDIKIEQVGDEEGPSKSMKDSLTSFVKADGRPVQWIYDRCNGHERVMDPNSKPCCCLMFPNGFLKLAPGKEGLRDDNIKTSSRYSCVESVWCSLYLPSFFLPSGSLSL